MCELEGNRVVRGGRQVVVVEGEEASVVVVAVEAEWGMCCGGGRGEDSVYTVA